MKTLCNQPNKDNTGPPPKGHGLRKDLIDFHDWTVNVENVNLAYRGETTSKIVDRYLGSINPDPGEIDIIEGHGIFSLNGIKLILEKRGFEMIEEHHFANEMCSVTIENPDSNDPYYAVANNSGDTIYSKDLNMYWLMGVLILSNYIDFG